MTDTALRERVAARLAKAVRTAWGLSREEANALFLQPPGTKIADWRLDTPDRHQRVARVYVAHAIIDNLLGRVEGQVKRWMRDPQPGFDGLTPIELAIQDMGKFIDGVHRMSGW